MKFSGRKILVVGMGLSGIAAAKALVKEEALLSVYDQKTSDKLDPELIDYFNSNHVECFFGNTPGKWNRYEQIVMSPGVPAELPFIQEFVNQGAELIGELELAYRMGRGNYVAITGTNGKTTTTVLTGEIFKNAGRKTEVVGNVGVAAVAKAAGGDDDTWFITEASSFQLETIRDFHPRISAILNLTPDHMDRHKTLENYGAAKARVYLNQGQDDCFVVNKDDLDAWKLAAQCNARIIPFSRIETLEEGAFLKDGNIVIKEKGQKEIRICRADELIIPGSHNLENALAASAIAWFSGISPQVIGSTLREFPGVAHRLEFAGTVKGVKYVNDSKGTNPDASIKAIHAMKEQVVLIAGGYDKGSSFEEYINAFGEKVKGLVLLGKTAQKIKETAEKSGFHSIYMAADMKEAVVKASELAAAGETVLLSPACASWDMYRCFEDRGDDFKNCVKNLLKN